MRKYNSLMEIITNRRSIRSYDPKEIEPEKIEYVLNAFRKAPSAKNLQPWKLIMIKDKNKRNDIAIACNNQNFISEAPVILAACAKEEEAYGVMGGYMSSYPIDIAIALEHLILAATEVGLGTCWIGAFKEQLVKDILKIPENIRVVALTPLGYPGPDAETPKRGRKSVSEIICYEKYCD
ncbi:MAG: nitroreductase family protein [Actinobacteria bacterium]|nr:nitroreductase family protein [Actinomycetota bacterium]